MKSKLDEIRKEVKLVAMKTFAELQAKGDVNEIDLNTFTSKVQANIIISILVGSQYCAQTVAHNNLTTGEVT